MPTIQRKPPRTGGSHETETPYRVPKCLLSLAWETPLHMIGDYPEKHILPHLFYKRPFDIYTDEIGDGDLGLRGREPDL